MYNGFWSLASLCPSYRMWATNLRPNFLLCTMKIITALISQVIVRSEMHIGNKHRVFSTEPGIGNTQYIIPGYVSRPFWCLILIVLWISNPSPYLASSPSSYLLYYLATLYPESRDFPFPRHWRILGLVPNFRQLVQNKVPLTYGLVLISISEENFSPG